MAKITGKARNIYRHMMVTYPSLYTCPLDVSCFIFSLKGGHGYDWAGSGQLVETLPRIKKEGNPVQDEIDRRKKQRIKTVTGGLKSLYTSDDLSNEANVIKYEFVLKNMKRILDAGPLCTFFEKHPYRFQGMLNHNINTVALSLRFPDNIQPEWAIIVDDFLGWWNVNIAQCYLFLDRKDRNDAIKHWPEDIRNGYKLVLKAHNRIRKIRYPGRPTGIWDGT